MTPYADRNYTVFSVLADVRNDGYVTPISEPRGLPSDATHADGTDEDGQDRSRYEYGDHSFSWLTLDEILVYDWKQEIRDEGWVDAETFTTWEASGAKGAPRSWSGGVSGYAVRHVSHSEMRRRIKAPYRWEKGEHPYTLIQWTANLSDYCKRFLDFVNSLAPLGEPKDIRLVFGFDS